MHIHRHSMTIPVAIIAGIGLVSAAMAQRSGESTPNNPCLMEIRQLCADPGRDRAAIIACVREKYAQLTPACQTAVQDRIDTARQSNGTERKADDGTAIRGTEHAYGKDARQRLDYYAAPSSAQVSAAPLVVFIHGGGWSRGDKATATQQKQLFYTAMGYGFASLNYRLVPDVTPAQQAQDIATALAYLRQNAAKLGFDPDRIAVMGHSAGAHLAALISTDSQYLDTADVPLSAIRGTILLDGAGYDVARQMANGGPRIQSLYASAFTGNLETQKTLSPMTHVGTRNVARWVIFHDAQRADARQQSQGFGTTLQQSGHSVKVVAVQDSSHAGINADAGKAGTVVGDSIATFMKSVF